MAQQQAQRGPHDAVLRQVGGEFVGALVKAGGGDDAGAHLLGHQQPPAQVRGQLLAIDIAAGDSLSHQNVDLADKHPGHKLQQRVARVERGHLVAQVHLQPVGAGQHDEQVVDGHLRVDADQQVRQDDDADVALGREIVAHPVKRAGDIQITLEVVVEPTGLRRCQKLITPGLML